MAQTPLATVERCQQEALTATNVGESGDETDLYHLLDRAAAAIRELHPALPCRRGCAECCVYSRAFFPVTATEWGVLRRFMEEELSPDTQAQIRAAVAKHFQPHAVALAAVGDEWTAHTQRTQQLVRQPSGEEAKQSLTAPCPLLREGACLAYPARPFVCRAFGVFSLKRYIERRNYTCAPWWEWYSRWQRAAGQIPLAEEPWLPELDLFERGLVRLTRGDRVEPLAGWLGRWRGPDAGHGAEATGNRGVPEGIAPR